MTCQSRGFNKLLASCFIISLCLDFKPGIVTPSLVTSSKDFAVALPKEAVTFPSAKAKDWIVLL